MIDFQYAGDVEFLVKALATATYESGFVEPDVPFFVPAAFGSPDTWELSGANSHKLFPKGDGHFTLADRNFCEKRRARWISVLGSFGVAC